jgi:hypothetical protein
MFGFFKKKAPDGSFILVALKSALVLRAAEKSNGGIYTPPDLLRQTTGAIAKQMNVELSGSLEQLTHGCVMELLMEQKFLDRLLVRSSSASIGSLTVEDENELVRITSKITGIT